jgi:hypothetical protein
MLQRSCAGICFAMRHSGHLGRFQDIFSPPERFAACNARTWVNLNLRRIEVVRCRLWIGEM